MVEEELKILADEATNLFEEGISLLGFFPSIMVLCLRGGSVREMPCIATCALVTLADVTLLTDAIEVHGLSSTAEEYACQRYITQRY